MPGTGAGGWGGELWVNITDFIKNGSIPESRVDDMVIRTLMPYFWLGQDTTPLPDVVYVRSFHLHHRMLACPNASGFQEYELHHL